VVCDEAAVDPTVLDAAEAAGLAVLSRAPDVPWGHLYSLLRTRMAGAPEASATAGDVFSIANALADLLGGHVLIEDAHGEVLAYSRDDHPVDDVRREAIVGHRTPGLWQERLRRDGVLRRLWNSDEVVRYDADGEIRPRLAAAVRAGDELLGSLWLIEGSRPFSQTTERDLREAAAQVAPHLARNRLLASSVHHQRGALFAAVLPGRLAPESLLMPAAGGADGPFVVVALRIGQPGPDASVLIAIEKVMSLVTMHCSAYRRPVLCTSLGRLVYLLLSEATAAEDELSGLFTPFVRQLVAKIAPVVAVTAGVGTPQLRIGELLASRTAADRVLQALALRPDLGPVADPESIASQLTLLDLAEHLLSRPASFHPAVRALVAHDAERRSDYAETVLAYLDRFGDINSAAEQVSVHPNTFRYRMRRLTQAAGVNLDDGDERLALQIQLRALRPFSRAERLRLLGGEPPATRMPPLPKPGLGP
jgi:hypothetical protein